MFKKYKKCPYCNEKVEYTTDICHFCGENISQNPENDDNTPVKFDNIIKKVLFIIIIFLLLTTGYFICNMVSDLFIYNNTERQGIEHLNKAYALYLPRFQRSYDEFNKAYEIATKDINRNENDDMAYAIKAAATIEFSKYFSAKQFKAKDAFQIAELKKKELNYISESKQLAEKALNINPNNFLALMVISEHYYNNENYKKSLSCIHKSIEQNPKFAHVYLMQYKIEHMINGQNRQDLTKEYKPYDLIYDINTAIKYTPKNSILMAELYNERANEKYHTRDYIGSIKDDELAIKQLTNVKHKSTNLEEIEYIDYCIKSFKQKIDWIKSSEHIGK